ncbi:hypothetical protein H5410_013220 [Solanum commersonii]|uniref:Uncharacterized protein n=1 Tax=Solanum commersonii TaxID=4109 RepID=A0A9J6AUU2_SOLCO|nr:hypothetical protein H5410_013220 [Solanum commersonii]
MELEISATKMDSEASDRTKQAQFPSNSMQDWILTIPILPPELGRRRAKWTFKEYLLRSLFFGSVTEARDFHYPFKKVGLSANGKLHWDTITVGPYFTFVCMGISYFDLANEKWETMEKPSYGVEETDLCLGMLGSDLCVFIDYKRTVWGYE